MCVHVCVCVPCVHAARCEDDCNNRGVCVKMDPKLMGPAVEAADNSDVRVYQNWDAAVSYGCNCDWGFTGPACAQSACAL